MFTQAADKKNRFPVTANQDKFQVYGPLHLDPSTCSIDITFYIHVPVVYFCCDMHLCVGAVVVVLRISMAS